MLKRILYLGYYLKELDRKKFKLFLVKVKQETGKSTPVIFTDIISSSLKYNISILEYFQFHFYKLTKEEREKYAGTGYMYEYQLKMNPKTYRSVLENKLEFLHIYKNFIHHSYASLTDLEKDPSVAEKILKNKSGKVVLKNSFGQCGNGIEVVNSSELNIGLLVGRLKKNGNDFVEEFVVQHTALMQLSPSGLNTVRIVTQVNEHGGVDLLAARLRITINSAVDNLAAGNIAAPINLTTGVVEGPGVYSDITKPDEFLHPVTKIPIVGFEVPHWKETIAMIRQAALTNTNNRSIGWDVAITDNGPELIEGNHDWCKLLWQLPVHQGLKADVEKYT